MRDQREEERGKRQRRGAEGAEISQRREGARLGRRPLQRLGEFAVGGDPFGFGDGYGLVDGDRGEFVDLAAGPVDFERVGLGVLSEAEG